MKIRSKIGSFTFPFTEYLESLSNIVWIELGVFKGFNAKCVLGNFDVSKMYLIDPYKANSIFSEKVMKESRECSHTALSCYEEMIEWKEMLSEDAAPSIPDNSVDVIFIDGDHSYEGVMQDLELFMPKIREGGLVIGDDHNEKDVEEAIKQYALRENFAYETCDYPSISGHRIMSMFWFIK